jgi:hypothetical protein
MSPERTSAYRRVMNTLQDLGPSKLWEGEQAQIREAADALIFSGELEHDEAARHELREVERLCRDLVASGRWEAVTAQRLADDVRSCGPSPAPRLRAA